MYFFVPFFLLERFVLYYTFFSLSTLFRHFFKKLFYSFFEQNKKLVISAFSLFGSSFLLLILRFFLLSFAGCLVLFYNSIFVSFCQHFFWFFYLFFCYYFLFFFCTSLVLIYINIFILLCQCFFKIFLSFLLLYNILSCRVA